MFPLWSPFTPFFKLFDCKFKLFYDSKIVNNIYFTDS